MTLFEIRDLLAAYWSASEVATNLLVFLNLAGALVLGALVGYERSYHGRAAGMRTYGLVCMASTGLTVVAGYPAFWYGGHSALAFNAQPTQVIQGIVTGVGFLGAGVIMKEGLNISGLTTAASIWTASAIGVLIGVGFYASAILLSVLSAMTMMWGSRLEGWLPSHQALGLSLRLAPGGELDLPAFDRFMRDHSYEIAPGSLSVQHADGRSEWKLVAVVVDRHRAASLHALAHDLQALQAIERFSITHARN